MDCFLSASFVERGGKRSGDPAFLFTEALGNSEAAGITLRQKRRRARVPSCRRSPYQNETCPRQPLNFRMG
jgi:hypothetical protein